MQACTHIPPTKREEGNIFSPPPCPIFFLFRCVPICRFPPLPRLQMVFFLFFFFRPRYGEKETMRWHLVWAIPPFFLSQGVLSFLSFFLYVFLWETIFVRHPSVSPTQSRDVFLLTSGAEGMAQEKRGKWRYVCLCPFYMHFSGTFTLFFEMSSAWGFPA